jgi:hypothetical protein
MQRTRAAGLSLCEWRQIKTQIYSTRAQAKSEIFDYNEGLFNRVDATSISINSAPMGSSGSAKRRYEICIVNWGKASFGK